MINCKDLSTIRSLTDEILILSDLELVRGVDYKSSDGKGLALLITHHLPSKRWLKQLLGRVGRYGEVCFRHYLDNLSIEKLVDEKQSLKDSAKIPLK